MVSVDWKNYSVPYIIRCAWQSTCQGRVPVISYNRLFWTNSNIILGNDVENQRVTIRDRRSWKKKCRDVTFGYTVCVEKNWLSIRFTLIFFIRLILPTTCTNYTYYKRISFMVIRHKNVYLVDIMTWCYINI